MDFLYTAAMAASILWYDLETFGLEPKHDRIAQFACLRTNEQLEPVSAGLVLFNRITPDYLPSPYACLVHRITPAQTQREGIPEYDFAKAIRAEMMMPGTCVAGFNSIRFDDEFMRNLFYRNLFDPYEREWADGNSRWDVIDLFRAARDLRPEGMVWPDDADGKPVFKLGKLAAANGIPLENAHDALHDITATVLLTKLLKDAQPKLFDWFWRHRSRDSLRPLINLARRDVLLHTSATYTSERGCTAPIAPVGMIPGRRDTVVAVDLRFDPAPLLDLPVEDLRRHLFARRDERAAALPEGGLFAGNIRVPLVEIKLAKCPFLSPLSALDKAAAARMGTDPALLISRAASLGREPALIQKLAAVFSNLPQDKAQEDPDYRIYSGGFFKDEDKDAMESVHEAIAMLGPEKARPRAYSIPFLDERLPQMTRRLFARNWPNTLPEAEEARWRSFCAGRLLCPRIEGATDYAQFGKIAESMLASVDTPPDDKILLHELLAYRGKLEKEILSYQAAGKATP